MVVHWSTSETRASAEKFCWVEGNFTLGNQKLEIGLELVWDVHVADT